VNPDRVIADRIRHQRHYHAVNRMVADGVLKIEISYFKTAMLR
jgi:hypothetical protein